MFEVEFTNTIPNGKSSRTVLAQRKDGKIRICVDYNNHNAVEENGLYPISIMDKLRHFGPVTIFSPFENNKWYRLVRIMKWDREKTTLSSHHELFSFIHILFGF